MIIINETNQTDIDRSEAFQKFAERRATGEVFGPPTLLPKEARRLHVRHTLREDHQFRIKNRPDSPLTSDGKAERIVESHDVHLVAGDPYYGQTEIDDQSFLVRERSPYKDDIDVDDLDDKELKKYARICGRTLAQPHARSDEDAGVMEGDAERRILGTINPDLFIDDVVRFDQMAAHRVYKDYELFKQDHDLGAFNFMGEQ